MACAYLAPEGGLLNARFEAGGKGKGKLVHPGTWALSEPLLWGLEREYRGEQMSPNGTHGRKLSLDSVLAPAGPFLGVDPCLPNSDFGIEDPSLFGSIFLHLLIPSLLMNPAPITVLMPPHLLFLCSS